jgi:regulator of replication initiation timing
MNKLEEAKTRLQDAITRLESAIQSKILKLELENSTLKAELTKLKRETKAKNEGEVAPTNTKKKSKEDKGPNLINAKTVNEVDISLNALKKLVR